MQSKWCYSSFFFSLTHWFLKSCMCYSIVPNLFSSFHHLVASLFISFSSLDYHFLRLYLVSDTLFFLYSILLFHEHSTDFLYLTFYIDLLCHFHLYTAPIYTAVARSRFVSYFSIFSSSFSVYLFFNLSSFYLSIYLIHLPFFLFLLFSISSIQLAHSHLLLVTHMIRLWIYLVKY